MEVRGSGGFVLTWDDMAFIGGFRILSSCSPLGSDGTRGMNVIPVDGPPPRPGPTLFVVVRVLL